MYSEKFIYKRQNNFTYSLKNEIASDVEPIKAVLPSDIKSNLKMKRIDLKRSGGSKTNLSGKKHFILGL